MIMTCTPPALAAVAERLGLVLPSELLDRLLPYLTPELVGGIAELALDPATAEPGRRGGCQHALTLGDI
jgi:hypothetical protein